MPTPTSASRQILQRFGRGLARLGRRALNMEPGQNLGFSLISPVLSGVVVTPQTALTLTAYYSAINVISTDVAKLPRLTYRTLRSGGKQLNTRDPRYRLLAVRPNPEMNAFRYWQAAMGHTLGWGNHYSEIVRDGEGMPVALWPLHPSTTRPMRDDRTKALYYEDVNTGRKWLPENILHLAGLGFDGLTGYSPATMARQAIGLGIGAEQFGASLFGNSAIPKGMLKTPKKLTELASRRLRSTFEEVHGGSQNANRVAVLEEGLEWVETQITPEDAQFLATRHFQVIEIARLFNLPPHKLGDYTHAHLANVEEANLDYLGNTLVGWLESIESEVNTKLYFDDEAGRYFCQHDLSALMRGNMEARSGYYKALASIGAISPDEVRGREAMNPIGPDLGGNKYLVQAQLVPLDKAGEAMQAKSGAGQAPGQTDPAQKPPANVEGDLSQVQNNAIPRRKRPKRNPGGDS